MLDHPLHGVRELLDVEMHRNKRRSESNFLPLWPTQPLGSNAQPRNEFCSQTDGENSGRPSAVDPPRFCSAGVGKRRQPSPAPNREGWEECAQVCMCGPWSKGRAVASLPNNIKKPKHFPLRNRITAHGILTQLEKQAAPPPQPPTFSVVKQRGLFFK